MQQQRRVGFANALRTLSTHNSSTHYYNQLAFRAFRSTRLLTMGSNRDSDSISATPLHPIVSSPYPSSASSSSSSSAAATAVASSISSISIDLDDNEKELFDLLNTAVKELKMKTTMRVAGGWVRDKLLGHSSHDIDIALDDQTGQTFAGRINTYLSEHGKKIRPAAVVQVNPEQSKHLETAILVLCGLSVDFVNLRAESYDDGTRIPRAVFGDALEDATRRDFTINSLFYNVASGEIEDLTGKGLDDLKRGIIRTPMPTRDTFMDDPLRILRAVRFACRLGFELDTELCDALKDESIVRALTSKVSIERVGKELTGMLNGPQPLQAIELLVRFNLTSSVFQMPPSLGRTWTSDLDRRAVRAARVVDAILRSHSQDGKTQDETKRKKTKEEDVIKKQEMSPIAQFCSSIISAETEFSHGALVLAAVLSPVDGDTYTLPNKTRVDSLVKYIVSDRLHLEQKLHLPLVHVVSHAPMWTTAMVSAEVGGGGGWAALDKLSVGNAVLAQGKLWRASLLLSIISNTVNGTCGCVDSPFQGKVLDKAVLDICTTFDTVMKQVDEWGLSDLWQAKVKVNGRDVIRVLGLVRGGPYVGCVLEAVQQARIINPNASKEDLEERVFAYAKKHPPPVNIKRRASVANFRNDPDIGKKAKKHM